MKIVYVALKYDYGVVERGLSFEHYNFFDTLVRMGHEIVYFDFMTLLNKLGRDGMNKRLLDVVKAERPDLMFTFLFGDELDVRVVRRISKRTDTTTLNWFADDHWRFETFSRRWAPSFDWVVTTASDAVPKYEAMGYRNVIKSQWACNHFLYKKLNVAPRYDVTFVGQLYGNRRAIITSVQRAGIDVRGWGHKWESGRLTQEDMIRVFNESRINLNLANAYRASERPLTALQRVSREADRHRVGRLAKSTLRPLVRAVHRPRGISEIQSVSAPVAPPLPPDQIKGRNFEVPGCGGFLLTARADDLERYYRPGEEIACFDSTDELVEQIIHYLEHDDERARIARQGYERTLREHTYVQRFETIFRRIGFDELQAGAPGHVMEVE